MSSTTQYRVDGLPLALLPEGPAAEGWHCAGGTVTVAAPAKSDMFLDPAQPRGTAHPDAPRLVAVPEGDFQLACRVTVGFTSTFDAGVLGVFIDEANWAKLCFEFTPQRTPSVVSVVTRGQSDDANAFETESNSVWLRISRTGRTFAFHASTDRTSWRLVRYFALTDPAATAATAGAGRTGTAVRVGFLAQSPTGAGCAITFDDVEFRAHAPVNLRDGS